MIGVFRVVDCSVFGAEVVSEPSFPCVLCALAQLQLRCGVCVLRGAKGAHCWECAVSLQQIWENWGK